jgi:TonB family protein
MSELALNNEFARIGGHTRNSIAVSAVLHALLFLMLAFYHATAGDTVGLTEITWIESAVPEGVPDAAPPVAEEETQSAPVREVKAVATREAETAEHFQRTLERGTTAPRPQSSRAVTDILDERISALENNASDSATRLASLVPPPKVGVPALAGTPDSKTIGAHTTPSTLNRDAAPGTGGRGPAALRRTEGGPSRPVMAAVVGNGPPVSATPAVQPEDAKRTRDLAGARIIGPVADRAVLSYQVPDYPEWAKREGIEGSVTLYFFVLPDGRVKENVLVERTSGFADFDDGAVKALLTWRFAALPGGSEQWGRITFNYRLGGAQ